MNEKLRELIAKWLFKNKDRFPNQRFYANWYDEIEASPLTEKKYLNLANEILGFLPNYETVQLEGLPCEDAESIVQKVFDKYNGKGLSPSEVIELHRCEYYDALSQATIAHNKAKFGKLYKAKGAGI